MRPLSSPVSQVEPQPSVQQLSLQEELAALRAQLAQLAQAASGLVYQPSPIEEVRKGVQLLRQELEAFFLQITPKPSYKDDIAALKAELQALREEMASLAYTEPQASPSFDLWAQTIEKLAGELRAFRQAFQARTRPRLMQH